MASIDDLTQQVNTLTVLVNSIISNSKTVSELTLQDPLVLSSEIPLNDGEKTTVQDIVDSVPISDKPIVTKISSYTLTSSDYTVECIGSFTITLPSAGTLSAKEYNIKNNGNGNILIQADGTETMDLSNSINLLPLENITIKSNGINWLIL